MWGRRVQTPPGGSCRSRWRSIPSFEVTATVSLLMRRSRWGLSSSSDSSAAFARPLIFPFALGQRSHPWEDVGVAVGVENDAGLDAREHRGRARWPATSLVLERDLGLPGIRVCELDAHPHLRQEQEVDDVDGVEAGWRCHAGLLRG